LSVVKQKDFANPAPVFLLPFSLLRLSKGNLFALLSNLRKNICKIHKKFKIFVEKVVE